MMGYGYGEWVETVPPSERTGRETAAAAERRGCCPRGEWSTVLHRERETVVIREAVLEEGYTKAARGVGCTRKRTTKLLLGGMRAPVWGEAEEPRRAAPGASMGEVSSLLLRGCSQELAS